MAECCGGNVKLIYACSGAADVGKIADEVARKLKDTGFGGMTCLAGIGAGLSGFIASAQGASENVTIDGCPVGCAKKTLENIGVMPRSYILTDMGLEKGKTPVTNDLIDQITKAIIKGSCCTGEPEVNGGAC